MSSTDKITITGPRKVDISEHATLGSAIQFIFHTPGSVTIGDYCTIGSSVKFICSGGDISVDDWTSIHENCLVLSKAYVFIGAHCWFGQNSVLDGTGGLTIGHGVRVGMYSQIWTHVAASEQIEGCTLFGERPVIIEDDVWLVGSCVVASGLTIGKKTIALIDSNITKSWPAHSTIAGVPATAKANLNFYTSLNLDEKWQLLRGWIEELAQSHDHIQGQYTNESITVFSTQHSGQVTFFKNTASYLAIAQNAQITSCCIENKAYTKRHSPLERLVLKYLAGNKARFFSQPI